jgi:long-subunit fatty acid transport protein
MFKRMSNRNRASVSRQPTRPIGCHWPAPRVLSAALPVFLAAAGLGGIQPHAGHASALLPMATGAADLSLNGASIARPLNPAGALLLNPAGLAGFEGTVVTSGIGVGWGSEKIDTPSGYNETNDVVALIPDFAVSFEGANGWRWGMGSYGSVGSNYDFPADADAGVPNDFHSESTIIGLPIGLARKVGERLWIGGELIPLLGHLRNRYTIGDTLFRYSLRGAGLQAMLGATWHATERWSFGIGVRTPGRLWMKGTMGLAPGLRQDVDLEVRMPAQVALGATVKLTPAVELSATARWTDSSSFGHSTFKFERTPEANSPFIADARDEWRGGLAVEWSVRPDLRLRAGASRSNRIVGSEGVTPAVFDNEDLRASAGIGYDRGPWTLDVMVGYSFHEGRDVGPERARVLPGHYDTGGGAVLFGLTRQL